MNYDLFAKLLRDGVSIYDAASAAAVKIKPFEKALNFYVYALVDPRDNLPFYIGKGKDRRATSHLRRHAHIGNFKKCAVIAEIREAGLEPLVFCVQENMRERVALSLEISLIRGIGYKRLTNLLVAQDRLFVAKIIARKYLRMLVHPDKVPKSEEVMYWTIVCEFAEILAMAHADA